MSKAYARVEGALRQIDSSGTPQALASLRASQASFTHFATDECQRRSDATLGGSGGGDIQLACQIDLTRRCTHALLTN